MEKINSQFFTPSEIVYLFGDQFVDDVRGQDSASELVLTSGSRTNTERLAVAVIRAAILANLELGLVQLSWRTARAELDDAMTQVDAVGGLGAKLIGQLTNLAGLQSKLDTPKPLLLSSGIPSSWPALTLESFFANIGSETARSVFELVEQYFGQTARVSGSDVICAVKDDLVMRGALKRYRRGFGLLNPRCELCQSHRTIAHAQFLLVRTQLNAEKENQPEIWEGLGNAITGALRVGLS